jgi:hypothetical protein
LLRVLADTWLGSLSLLQPSDEQVLPLRLLPNLPHCRAGLTLSPSLLSVRRSEFDLLERHGRAAILPTLSQKTRLILTF